jgi:hypothetical protein
MRDPTDHRIGSRQVPATVLGLLAAAAAAVLAVRSAPVRDGIDTAPLVLAAIAGVCADALGRTPRRVRGLATGIAAAFDPVALAALPLLWFTGRRRAALLGTGAAAATVPPLTAVDGLPGSSWRPLLTDRYLAGDTPDASVHGMLLRIAGEYAHGITGADTPALTAAALLFGAAASVLALRRAVRFHSDGQPLLAIAVAACAGIAALPVSWSYELLWLPLALGGRLGTRPEERPVWPVLILTALAVPADAIDPRIDANLSIVLGNVPTLVAVAAACALPFRSPADPHWGLRRAEPPPTGRRALLPSLARPVTRPNLLLELLLIRAGYWIYQNIRGDLRTSIPHQRDQAIDNADLVIDVEQFFRFNIEPAVNRLALKSTRLFELMLDYYRELHYTVPVAVLVWLYIWHPTRYRTARTVLAFTTGLALVGFWLFPLCPPRLYPGSGMVASLPDGPRSYIFATQLINSYAAMPSLHIGWALWCAVAVVCVARSRWLKALAVLYPCATAFVVVGTANHWILDGVGAAAAVTAAVFLQQALTGRRLRDDVPAFQARLGTAPVPAPRTPAARPGEPGTRPAESAAAGKAD